MFALAVFTGCLSSLLSILSGYFRADNIGRLLKYTSELKGAGHSYMATPTLLQGKHTTFFLFAHQQLLANRLALGEKPFSKKPLDSERKKKSCSNHGLHLQLHKKERKKKKVRTDSCVSSKQQSLPAERANSYPARRVRARQNPQGPPIIYMALV